MEFGYLTQQIKQAKMKFDITIEHLGIELAVTGDFDYDAGSYDTPPYSSCEVETVKPSGGVDIYDLLSEDMVETLSDIAYTQLRGTEHSPEHDD